MATPVDYQWAYSIMDSSRVSTFLISILLIVYGSFRSLNMEQEAREREKEKERTPSLTGLPATTSSAPDNNVQTLDTMQALCLPLGASVSLLVMFFFFDSMQMLFAICTAIIATVALAFLLLPMCQYVIRPCSDGNKISFGVCGRFTGAELLSFSLAVFIVCIWVLTGHWLLMDAMGMGLCVAFIAFVRLPSLKVSTLLLTGLLIYDVFWVFFSSYIFNTNVMVKVATRPAENPVGLVARKLHLGGVVKEAPKLSLPGKLVFPSLHNQGHFSMLGLGDVVMPGLLLCFVLRYDAYKKSQLLHLGETGVPPPKHFSKLSYFHCSLIGYFLGLLTATVSSEVFKAAQPALLYLVPFTLLPLLTMAYLKEETRVCWEVSRVASLQKESLCRRRRRSCKLAMEAVAGWRAAEDAGGMRPVRRGAAWWLWKGVLDGGGGDGGGGGLLWRRRGGGGQHCLERRAASRSDAADCRVRERTSERAMVFQTALRRRSTNRPCPSAPPPSPLTG